MTTEVILFDLGGVVVEMSGVAYMATLLDLTHDEVWRRWGDCPAVANYETGRSSREQFSAGVVEHFALDMTSDAFLEAFRAWPMDIYAGTKELIGDLRPGLRYGASAIPANFTGSISVPPPSYRTCSSSGFFPSSWAR